MLANSGEVMSQKSDQVMSQKSDQVMSQKSDQDCDPLQVCRMRYCSTRGGVHGRDFQEVLFSGYAPDGGMFMPERLPPLSPDTLRSWKGLSYTQVVVEVVSLFVRPQLIPRGDLEGEPGKHSPSELIR